jgi:Ca-activated chloride channel family protein
MGRGISHVVRHDEVIDQVVDKFFEQINNPVLGNLSLHWEGPGEAPSFYPMAIPDLFAEQPLVLFGRKLDKQSGTLQIKGIEAGGKRFEKSFKLTFEPSGNTAIAQLWGRSRIKELMTQMVSGETTRGVDAVTKTALAYQLLSQYTAFVAVSDEVRVEQPQETVSVDVPVLIPEAISHEDVFGVAAGAAAPVRARMAKPMAKKAAAPSLRGPLKLSASMESHEQEGYTAAIPPNQVPAGAADSFEDATEEFDMLLESSLVADDDEFAAITPPELAAASPQRKERRRSAKPPQQITILKAEGLTDDDYEQLTQHLQSLQLTAPQTGKLIFELVIQAGRVKRVMIDEDASDPQNPDVVEQIRRALVAWHCPQTLTAPVRVEMMVKA